MSLSDSPHNFTPEPLEVCRASRQMPAEHCYEYLLSKVLPADSNRIRLTVDYLPTNPSPPVVEKYGTGEAPFASNRLRTMFRTGGAGKESVLKLKSMQIHAEQIVKP